MKIKTLLALLTLLLANNIIGQSLDEYKYVIIPSKYDFQKSEDQHQLNSLTKFLFEKEGLNVVYDNLEMPADVVNNPCSALRANVNNESNMFTTKLVIELTNCKNQTVLTSQMGISKEKNYKKGYQEALRGAFESVTAQNYSSKNFENNQSMSTVSGVQEAENVVQHAKEAVQNVESDVEEVSESVIIETSEDETSDEIAITVMEDEVEEVEEIEDVEETEVDHNVKSNNRDRDDNGNILGVPTEKKLYAQENYLGYQLIDSKPKVVFLLLKSGKKDMYYLKNRSGIFFKEENKWYAEYYFGGHLLKQEFDVKW